MPRTRASFDSLTELLDESTRPVYAVDARRRIVYCNPALAAWLELKPEQIVGRLVEYHSEPAAQGAAKGAAAAPLADLCPPPSALAGQPTAGTISCMARDGRLQHRRAEFAPFGLGRKADRTDGQVSGGVLVLLDDRDLSPQELTTEVSGEPSADELHRAIRRFRRAQAGQYAIESLLGDSSAMRKVRAQIAAAAASGANALIYGHPGSGRGHVARAIHYRAASDPPAKLVPVDGEVTSDDLLRRAIDAVRQVGDARQLPTLLLENLDRLAASHQSQLLAAIRQNALPARIIATCGRHFPQAAAVFEAADTTDTSSDDRTDGARRLPAVIEPALLDAVSTITVRVPRLVERLEDLPILAQFFLEACNRSSGKQVGSIRADALDLLALYSWPKELDELRDTIVAAYRACNSHEIVPADLPTVVHHASQTASRIRRRPERIVLDDLLWRIEREAIVRALAQVAGNKTEAAELLGMTRPRLYRRLVQLGLASETPTESEPAGPEFIEQPSDETL